MMQKIKGYIFTMDSSVSAMLFAVIAFFALSSIYFSEAPKADELIILQKEHDMLKIWLLERPSKEIMVNKAKEIFGDSFSLTIDGKRVFDCSKSCRNAISSKLIALDKNLEETEIILTVCH
ncbi:MAG: hypothetical protein N3F05_02310 [Candidatus Diapherotrites archaeon]|nr:hypothetical protein [Candidatus Diapherotrites archaeon]